MLKKYIDSTTIADVPKNGVVTVQIENENGEIAEKLTGISNLNIALSRDTALANRNGYYEYVDASEPEYDTETQYISFEYVLENNIITKVYSVHEIEE